MSAQDNLANTDPLPGMEVPSYSNDKLRLVRDSELRTYGNQQFNTGREFEAERLAAKNAMLRELSVAPAPGVDLIARGMRWEECEALMKEACAQAGVQWDDEKAPKCIAINVMQRLAHAAHKAGFTLGLERMTEALREGLARTAAPAPAQDGPGFDECVASGQSCSYGPHGRKGEMQCQYCGAEPPTKP